MSPFAAVLDEAGLPAALREQFLVPDDASYRILLRGRMDRVWHRPRWLKPFLHLLARWNMIFPETGTDVPSWLVIAPDGRGGQVWRRTFRFAVLRRFDALMLWDGTHVVERTRVADILWNVSRPDRDTIEIETVGAAVRIGRMAVRVPRAFVPHVRAVERASGDHRISIDLTMCVPGLGPVFGYSGTFEVSRVDG